MSFTLFLIAPTIVAAICLASFSYFPFKKRTKKQALLNYIINYVVLYIPAAISVFDVTLDNSGMGGIVFLLGYAIAYLLSLATFIIQIILAHREAKKNNSAPSVLRSAFLILGIVLSTWVVTIIINQSLSAIQKKVYPYGLGKTKNTQFSGDYMHVNVSGVEKIFFSATISEIVQELQKYNDIDLCLYGRVEKNDQKMFVRSGTDDVETMGPGQKVLLEPSTILSKIRCEIGTQCAGNLTICGHLRVGNYSEFGSRLEPVSISQQDETQSIYMSKPYLERNKLDGTVVRTGTLAEPLFIPQALLDAKYLLNHEVCIQGLYFDNGTSNAPLLKNQVENAYEKNLTALHARLPQNAIPSLCETRQGITACVGFVKACGKMINSTPGSEYPYSFEPRVDSIVLQ